MYIHLDENERILIAFLFNEEKRGINEISKNFKKK